jgi:hypothetical protein
MAAPSTKTADWIAYVSESTPGGFGIGDSGFTEWFSSKAPLNFRLKSLRNTWPDASPGWNGTFGQLCTSTDDFGPEQRREFLESLDDSNEDPPPNSQRNLGTTSGPG